MSSCKEIAEFDGLEWKEVRHGICIHEISALATEVTPRSMSTFSYIEDLDFVVNV